MITVGIVEDNTLFREGLERLLADTPGMRCACACGSAEEALHRIPRLQPDVVLMDLHLPNRSGIECTAGLTQQMPNLKVVVLTIYEDTMTLFKALQAGAIGYLLKRAKPEHIVDAIREVRRGGAPMTSEIARKVVAAFHQPIAPRSAAHNLSRREREILDLLARGFANKEIAQHLSLSVETVRVHLRHVYDKLHVRSRTQAVAEFMGLHNNRPPEN
ncbi:MAG: response regulator transcription factor [Verrucomicrobia bacterium]|nr:response regulator transcription factor [Verrucomicrobiota bacterium]